LTGIRGAEKQKTQAVQSGENRLAFNQRAALKRRACLCSAGDIYLDLKSTSAEGYCGLQGDAAPVAKISSSISSLELDPRTV
jgi:hypothetical protein